MPSTSQEMLDYMESKHGPEFDDTAAEYFLINRGWKLSSKWSWTPPEGVTSETLDQDDLKHIIYLIEEWDYDGIDWG